MPPATRTAACTPIPTPIPAPGAVAEPLVEAVVAALRGRGALVETGRFGAQMEVGLVNDGPFTVLVEV